MSVFGHEERFPPTSLSAGCGFRKERIAGCADPDLPCLIRDGEVRPKPAARSVVDPLLADRIFLG
jgi:hypothetical protein